jgi:2-polyprenyl-6-methoxyphenol hydroxylase-like FAD-dependent oxidoreductase
MSKKSTRERAVVLGGGMAGLLAARVLADHYANVTIVERDRLPDGPWHRRGTPQGLHTHGLLPRGLRTVEELLPGITNRLVGDGALTGDVLADARWNLGGRPVRRTETGLRMLSASRALVEGGVRDRVRALANVTILDGHDIVGLAAAPGRITAVRATSLHGEGSRVLPADLVVDASGRGSRTPRWLAELGYATPDRDRVTVDLSYATRLFRRPPGGLDDDLAVVTARYPGQRRSGVMVRVEGGHVMVTLAGVLGERPPLDLAGFQAYARTLATPETYEFVRAAESVGEPAAFRVPTYTRYRYERLDDVPTGLLVVGDAACAFNPVYAQGMTVAAMGALVLRDELRLDAATGPDPRRFFAALAGVLEVPWRMAVGADLAMPGVVGPALPPSPLSPDYLVDVQRTATEDPVVAAAFMRVTSLVDPPSALLRPEIAQRLSGRTLIGA